MAELNRLIGGVTCSEVLALLSAYLDGELQGEELAAVEAHAAACDNCGRFGGRFAEAITALRRSAVAEDDAGRTLRLQARLERELAR
ncbi:MAG: zf-HC2 domain-containing protein [Gemmatimonadales bacterium]